jgi:purine nucleosidase
VNQVRSFPPTRRSLQRALLLFLFSLCSFLLGVSGWSSAQAPPHRVIIDTDPGTDDAMAILLALNSPELRLEALTVVAGNVTADQGLDNALRLVSLAGRCDIAVAGGARRPLTQKLTTAELVHGQNGLGDVALPTPKCRPDSRFAPDLIIDLVKKSPGEITLVPVGPLTNIALAVFRDPSIVPLVRRVVIMGGSVTEGNVTAVAEANIYNDPEAAQVVFNAGWPLTMVGLDVTHRTLFARSHRQWETGPILWRVTSCAVIATYWRGSTGFSRMRTWLSRLTPKGS